MNKNNQGEQPAFPIQDEAAGLSKREYIAAMAMQGFCASGIGTDKSIQNQLKKSGFNAEDENVIAEAIAIFSVSCADALLTQLNQQP